MKKKKYTNPEVGLYHLAARDILTQSGQLRTFQLDDDTEADSNEAVL